MGSTCSRRRSMGGGLFLGARRTRGCSFIMGRGGESVEIIWKSDGKRGKSDEKHGKSMDKHRKVMEKYGKRWISSGFGALSWAGSSGRSTFARGSMPQLA